MTIRVNARKLTAEPLELSFYEWPVKTELWAGSGYLLKCHIPSVLLGMSLLPHPFRRICFLEETAVLYSLVRK